MKFLKNKSGVVFMLVLIVSMIMVLVGVAASNMLLRDSQMVRHLRQLAQAQHIAEAGVARTLVSLATSASGFSASAYDSTGTSFGSGTYDVNVDEITVDEEDRWLITSTGKVGGTSRTVSMEVKDISSTAVQYALAAGTNIYLKANQGSITVKGNIHANNNLTLHEINSDLEVQALSPLTGKATCSSTKPNAYSVIGAVTIADSTNSGGKKPRLNMPTFDFAYFKATAIASGKYYDTGQTFTNNLNVDCGNTAGLTYVDGDATFVGTCKITGGFIAKGSITLNNNNALTQVAHVPDAYPIFMSETGSRIRLYGNFTSTDGNIIYAANDIQIETPGGGSSVLGTVIAGGSFTITANAALTLTYQNITATNVQPKAIEVISWNR